MQLTRRLIALMLTGAGMSLVAGPAQAAPPQPTTQTVPLPGQDTAGTAGFCRFPVTVVTTSYSELRGGTQLAGHGVATVTNDVTGEPITYNISGPGSVTATPDGGYTV